MPAFVGVVFGVVFSVVLGFFGCAGHQKMCLTILVLGVLPVRFFNSHHPRSLDYRLSVCVD